MEENKILQKLEQHDQKFDRIITKLIEHDEKLNNIVTKDEFQELKEESFQKSDEIISIVKKLDEERIFTIGRIDRIENEVGTHGTEINKIKVQLNTP